MFKCSIVSLAASLLIAGWATAIAADKATAVAAAPNAAPNAAQTAAPPAAPAAAPTALPAGTQPQAGESAQPAPAAKAVAPTNASLDERIQDAKGDVIRLNRDLLVLEEELLFPANTQVAVFVSMDVGKYFALDSVQIKLGDKLVASHLYTPAEVQALHRGGVQRLHVGNLKAGKHELVALFTGKGTHDRDYKRGATLMIEKGTEPKYVELRITDRISKLQPEFDVKVWQ